MEAAASVSSEIENAVEAARPKAMTIEEVKKALTSIDQDTRTNVALAAWVADSSEGLSHSAESLPRPFDGFGSGGVGETRDVA